MAKADEQEAFEKLQGLELQQVGSPRGQQL